MTKVNVTFEVELTILDKFKELAENLNISENELCVLALIEYINHHQDKSLYYKQILQKINEFYTEVNDDKENGW